MRRTIAALTLLLVSSVAAYGQSPPPDEQDTKTLNLSAYAELIRRDVVAQKVVIITEVMGFTEAEDAAFWPIYREYDAEMAKLGDERVAMIAEYASTFETLTDAIAEKLATRALDLETRRQAARARCYDRVRKALSPRTALRFLQVEHQLQLLIDLQIAAALPIAKERRVTTDMTTRKIYWTAAMLVLACRGVAVGGPDPAALRTESWKGCSSAATARRSGSFSTTDGLRGPADGSGLGGVHAAQTRAATGGGETGREAGGRRQRR